MAGVRHVVLFRWRAGVTDAQVESVAQALHALRGKVPEIRDYRFGADIGVNDGNHDYAVVADFDSIDDYVTYRDHPDHRAVVADVIAPLLDSRVAVQYEID